MTHRPDNLVPSLEQVFSSLGVWVVGAQALWTEGLLGFRGSGFRVWGIEV